MPEPENKRVRRTPQQIADAIDAKIESVNSTISLLEAKKETVVAELNQKISAKKAEIISLEKKKQKLLAPKPPRKPRQTKKKKIEVLLKQAQKSGLSLEEIADKLGLESENG